MVIKLSKKNTKFIHKPLNHNKMKKQTAVEWLVEQIFGDHTSEWQKQIDEAKTIENKQAIEFGKIIADKWGMVPVPLENIEETYNKTFKSE